MVERVLVWWLESCCPCLVCGRETVLVRVREGMNIHRGCVSCRLVWEVFWGGAVVCEDWGGHLEGRWAGAGEPAAGG